MEDAMLDFLDHPLRFHFLACRYVFDVRDMIEDNRRFIYL